MRKFARPEMFVDDLFDPPSIMAPLSWSAAAGGLI
jgi:hypothetical protein